MNLITPIPAMGQSSGALVVRSGTNTMNYHHGHSRGSLLAASRISPFLSALTPCISSLGVFSSTVLSPWSSPQRPRMMSSYASALHTLKKRPLNVQMFATSSARKIRMESVSTQVFLLEHHACASLIFLGNAT
jgi:hypothetical protein